MQTYLEVVMGLRAYLREERRRRRWTQKEMAEFISQNGGAPTTQAAVSSWELEIRYPMRDSRKAIKRAFGISERKWKRMLWVDIAEELPTEGAVRTA